MLLPQPLRRDCRLRNLSSIAVFLSCVFALSPQASAEEQAQLEVLEISKNRHFEKVERLMNASAAKQVEVRIAPGRYKLRDSFHVARSNVAIVGAPGVVLRLANRAQKPVIAIGSQVEAPTEADRIENIVVSDLEIDGNKDKQRSEYDRDLPWIRNNGIDVRTVSNLALERVTSSNNRSGGFVVSWACRDVRARNCVFENNYFDGVAYYDSARVYTIDCLMRANEGAGVSLDNAFEDSMFARCRIEDNLDVGVFARHSSRLVFYDCSVTGSGNWAFFLSHDERGNGVFDVDIVSSRIEGNNGGVRMGSDSEAQSARNSVREVAFADNGAFQRDDLSTAGSQVTRFDETWSSPEAIAYEDETGEPQVESRYSERIEQAILAVESPNGG